MKLWYVLAACAFILSACENSAHDTTASDVLAGPSAIVGGIDTPKENPTSKYLALIFDKPTESYCTAMLVDKNILLTAAHCIKSPGPENLTLAFGNRPLAGQYIMRSASAVLIHPQYKNNAVNRNDLALIRIKEGAPEGYESLSIPEEKFPLKDGHTFTASGYGRVTGKTDPSGADVQGSGVLRHVELQIDSFSDDQSQFYVSQKDGKGICNGDSGGPAMMRLNAHDYVVGVASAIAWLVPGELSDKAKQEYMEKHDVCLHKSIYINVKKYRLWISDGIKQLLSQ